MQDPGAMARMPAPVAAYFGRPYLGAMDKPAPRDPDKITERYPNRRRRRQIADELRAAKGQTTSLRPLRYLLPFVLRYPWRLALMLAFLATAAISQLGVPLLTGQVVDIGFIEQNLDAAAGYTWAFLALGVVMALASAARAYYISILGERVVADLRQAVFSHLISLDTAFYDMNRTGELTSRLGGDVGAIRMAVGMTASIFLRSSLTIIGSLTLMLITSPMLTIVALVLVPLLFVPVTLLGQYVRHFSRRERDLIADLTAMATEIFGAIRSVKSFTREPEWVAEYTEASETTYDTEAGRMLIRSVLIAATLLSATVATVVVVWMGVIEVDNGGITVGQFAQFLIYTVMVATSMRAMSEIWGTIQTIAGSTDRLVDILETEPAVQAPDSPLALPEPSPGTVAFKDVRFSYQTRDNETIIDGLSFSVPAGKSFALVGPSGAGKTTCFALLQRFYDPQEGQVLIDGVDAASADPAAIRRRIAYVEQDPVMFSGSIEFNIRFGRPDASDEEVREAARAALVDEFADKLENGYATLVGERGVMLSGGQRQRVAIARALLKDAPILLLDEATSALDAQSERLVQEALERLKAGRTTLTIAHRLATIRAVDSILYLEKGRLVDQGSHDELVAKGGAYADLAALQFSD